MKLLDHANWTHLSFACVGETEDDAFVVCLDRFSVGARMRPTCIFAVTGNVGICQI